MLADVGTTLSRLTNLRRTATAVRIGPIGFDLARQTLHAVQMEYQGRTTRIRAAISAPYPCPREELLEHPARFKRFVRQTLSRKPFRGRSIVTCVPPSDVRLSLVEYPLGPDQDEEQTIAALAAEQFDGDPADWVLDYIPVRRPDGDTARAALITCVQRATVLAQMNLLTGAGLEVEALEIGPVALGRLVTTMNGLADMATVLMVNFGRQKTYMTVFSGRRLILEREVPFGEQTVASLVAENLEMALDDAAAMLYRYGVGGSSGADEGSEVGAVLEELAKHRLVDLSREIERVAIYSASQLRGAAIDQIYILGSLARWPGADALLSSMLSLPVSVLDPFDAFAATSDAAMLSDLDPIAGIAVATGSALRQRHGARADA